MSKQVKVNQHKSVTDDKKGGVAPSKKEGIHWQSRKLQKTWQTTEENRINDTFMNVNTEG